MKIMLLIDWVVLLWCCCLGGEEMRMVEDWLFVVVVVFDYLVLPAVVVYIPGLFVIC